MDRYTQLVLHLLRNVQPVQLVMQQMADGTEDGGTLFSSFMSLDAK